MRRSAKRNRQQGSHGGPLRTPDQTATRTASSAAPIKPTIPPIARRSPQARRAARCKRREGTARIPKQKRNASDNQGRAHPRSGPLAKRGPQGARGRPARFGAL